MRTKKKKKKSIASTNTCKTCAQRFTLTPLRGDLFHSVELRPHAVRDRKSCLRWQKHVAEGRCEMSQEAPALPFKRLESWRNWAAGHHIPDRLTQRSTWAAELSGDSARAASWLGSVWRCFVTDFLHSLKQNPACFFQVKSGLVNISTSKCFLLTHVCQYPVFFQQLMWVKKEFLQFRVYVSDEKDLNVDTFSGRVFISFKLSTGQINREGLEFEDKTMNFKRGWKDCNQINTLSINPGWWRKNLIQKSTRHFRFLVNI